MWCVREGERQREKSRREIGGKRFNFVDEVKSRTWIATLSFRVASNLYLAVINSNIQHAIIFYPTPKICPFYKLLDLLMSQYFYPTNSSC